MKPSNFLLIPLLMVPSISSSHAQLSTNFQLRLELRTNALDLVVDGNATSGAFFIYRASDLQSLLNSPSLAVQTNTPLMSGFRFSLPMSGVSPQQAFFTAAHWPGRTIEEFGEPENYPDIPPPEMLLFTDGAPEPLTSGQPFTVDFYITSPSGQTLDVSGPVAILVFRTSDGARHPNATVSPATAQLTNGHMRVSTTVQATTSLDGYVLGLGPATGGEAAFLEGFFAPASSGLNQNLPPAANVSPQTLAQRRIDSADAGPSWSYPLAVTGHPLSGTFGEWRGRNNNYVHRGVDLAAVAANTVVASRGGVVSHRGTLTNPNQGAYLVVDHGGGWFSRYLHLDAAHISVSFGQAVTRGATLATRLYAEGAWKQHLHFEIRSGANQARWDDSLLQTVPSRDPLQEQILDVGPGEQSPQLLEFGLTRSHPGEIAFVKTNPTADAPGQVFLFAKFLDLETGHRLGLRAMNFQPEGLTPPIEIRPRDDTAIASLLPPASAVQKGFARYSDAHANEQIPLDQRTANYFRYWWRWDTSAYATDNERKGPRSLLLSGTDHNPVTAEFRFTFGPEVTSNLVRPVSALQYEFTLRAHLGTNTPAALGNAALFVQPDQYKLEIIRTNGQPLDGVMWSGPMAGNYTRLFTTHLDEAVYTFTLPPNALTETIKLRVSSRLVPDIAHEVCLCGESSWIALNSGMSGEIAALAVSGSDLFAGGGFTVAGGVAANNIAKWNGSSWTALGSGINGVVLSLAASGGDVFAAGSFTLAGGVAANNIAKWNGSSWTTLGSGMNGTVFSLAVSDGYLYAGGAFSMAGGNPASNIAYWDGSSWRSPIYPRVWGVNGAVRNLAISGGNLYVGGHFRSVFAGALIEEANYVVKWNGSGWSRMDSGMNGAVLSLATSGDEVFAGGTFTVAGGVTANNIAIWNGNSWIPLGSGVASNSVWALAVSGSDLYAGGTFITAGGVSATNVAKWNGSIWSSLGSGLNNGVLALAVSSSDLYVGGIFTTAGMVSANRIAKWSRSR